MRHRKKRQLKGSHDRQRKTLRALANSLILHEQIETTQARARLTKSKVEKLITKGKKGDLNARRLLLKDLSQNASKKVLEVLSPRFKSRPGGYTRMIKTGINKDGTKKVKLEFVSQAKAVEKK